MRLDLEQIRQAYPLPDIIGSTVKLQRAGNEWKACCPFHNERSPSFTVYAGGRRFYCFGCGASGDVLDYVQRSSGVGLREAADMLGAGNLPSVNVRSASVAPDGPDRTEEARAIWRNAAPVQGTPAESYLRTRGLHLAIPQSIRFARLPYGKRGRLYPCLVAAVASVDNRLSALV